jgi:predicted DNA-binding transcriptional regulator AlpA
MPTKAKTIPSVLPEIGFMRQPQVLQVYPVSVSTWWAGIKSGRFPQPVRLGPRTVAWKVEDIRRLINEATAGSAK